MGRAPDYFVVVSPKEKEGYSKRIGAAWLNPSGNISIRLDVCVVLSHDVNTTHHVLLKPNKKPTKVHDGSCCH